MKKSLRFFFVLLTAVAVSVSAYGQYCLYRCVDTLEGGYCAAGTQYTDCAEYPECPEGNCINQCNGSGWEYCI